jgi:cytochrome c553
MRRTIALLAGCVMLACLASCGKKEADKQPPAPVPAPAAAPAVADASVPPVDAATIARGAQLFQEKTCIACHGADARTSLLPIYPKIAGQVAIYAEQQMKDIKNGVRTNGQSAAMQAIMTMVSEEEIKILAAYLSSLPDTPANSNLDKASPGARLFKTKTCFTCHGNDGRTPLLEEYPKIAGQNADYALQQMLDIKNGTRANGQSAAMQGVMHLVNDEEMKILAEYLASLAP